MSLYSDWKALIDNQTDDTFQTFWKEYSGAEKAIYAGLLSHVPVVMSGVVKDLAESYHARVPIFMGFLDGINTSLRTPLELESVTEDTDIYLDVDTELLYHNMLEAKADYLYGLPQWDAVLSEETRAEIEKKYKRSKTVVKEQLPGRNDPCPCGSGKKYKKCCGS